MSFIQSTFEKVRGHPKRVVFPESGDDRILQAAVDYRAAGLGAAILLGSREAIQKRAHALKLDVDRVGIVNPDKADDLERFANAFREGRRSKGMALEEALSAVRHPVYFATMMLHAGSADAMVAGATVNAAAILRPLFQIIPLEPGVKIASSCSVVQLPNRTIGEDGVLLLADCNVIPDPSADQLADIALMSAKLARQLHGVKPRVAFLSYSTKGSARHRTLEKILAAVALARQRAGDRFIEAEFDGELQVDAALIPAIAENKSVLGAVAGKANVLIFPDLNSGNIGTKLLHVLCGGTMYGPILNGLSKPASDIARASTATEILGTAAIVALQCVEYRKIYPDAARASGGQFIY